MRISPIVAEIPWGFVIFVVERVQILGETGLTTTTMDGGFHDQPPGDQMVEDSHYTKYSVQA